MAAMEENSALKSIDTSKSHDPNGASREATMILSEKEIEKKLAKTVEPPDGGWGWVVVLSSFLIHVIIDGITYSMGVLFVALLDDYGKGKADTAFVVSLFVGVTLGSGPIASGMVNLWGCRIVTMAGALIGAFGFILSSFAPTFWFLYISVGIVAGFGFGLIYLPAIVVVSYYFEERRALATGIACCGSGVGTFIFSLLMKLLIDEYGWKQSCWWIAGILLQCVVLGALFKPLPLVDNTEDVNQAIKEETEGKPEFSICESQVNTPGKSSTRSSRHPSGTHRSQGKLTSISSLKDMGVQGHHLKAHIPLHRKDVFYSGSLHNIPLYQSSRAEYTTSNMSLAHVLHISRSKGVAEPMAGEDDSKPICNEAFVAALRETVDFSLLKNWCFILFLLSNLCTNLGFNAPYLYIPDRAIDMGISDKKAAFLLSIVGITNTIGRVLFGWLADLPEILPRRMYLYSTGLTVAGIATAVSMAPTYAAQVAYAAVFGLLMGCYVSLTAIMLVDLVGVEKLTSSFGMTLLVQGVAVIVGPPMCGWIYDMTGSYTYPFVATGLAIAISGAMLYFIPLLARWQKKHISHGQVDMGVRIGVVEGEGEEEAQTLK